jgi:hypothetical protein
MFANTAIRHYRPNVRLCMILFILTWPLSVIAQAVPSANGGASYGIYGLVDGGRPNYYSDWLVGGTVGGYFQHSPWLGLDGQVTALRWGPSQEHQYFALIGPRFALDRGRWEAFGTAEGGLGHARFADSSAYGGGWMLTGGVDMRLNARLSWRVGQFSYGRIAVLEHGLNPKIVSSGLVIRLF